MTTDQQGLLILDDANPICPFCRVRPAMLLCDNVIGFLWSGELSPSHIGVTLKDGSRSSIPNPNGDHYRIIETKVPEMFTCDRPICSGCSTHRGNIFFDGEESGVTSIDSCPQCQAEEREGLNPITRVEAIDLRKKMWSRSAGLLHLA